MQIDCLNNATNEDFCSFMYTPDLSNARLYYGLRMLKSIIEPEDNRMTKSETEEFNNDRSAFMK